MSVGVGVGDILLVVNKILVLYGQCMDAPEELQDAGRNVDQMRTALEVLSETINDRKSLMAKQPKIALIIKHEMKPLKENLLAMNTILNDYIDRSNNMGAIGRVRYALLDHNKLQSLQSNLTKSRTNFGLMLNLINIEVQEQHARADHTINERLSALHDKQIKESEARKAEAKARANSDAKLDDILQTLQDRLPAAMSPSQVLDQLQKELQRVGLSKEKAQAARLNAAQALSEKRTAVPMPSLLHPKEEHLEKRRSSDPSPKKSHESLRSPRAPKDTPKIISLRKLPELTKDYRILCVDRTHGIRAILAHTYLEVLRVWTANRTGRWLFKRVHSAGLLIGTNAKTCIHPFAIQGVSSLLANDGYDWASDAPHETRVIGQRMKSYNPFGFTAADLSTYDIVLCFNRTDAGRISKIKAESENRAQVIALPGCQHISSAECAKDPGKIGQLISNIKTAIKGFITQELGDWTNSLERTTNYRTLQLLLPGRDLDFAGTGDFLTDRDRVKDYENKSGCAIKITKYKGSTKEVLISVVGPKERLAKAVALIGPGTNSSISVS